MTDKPLQNFKTNVVDKYTIFNSLFSALPFSGVHNSGTLLPILLQQCIEGFNNGRSPTAILDRFFNQHGIDHTEPERVDRLFKFIQYVERQVVLFDALEDAAFASVNDMQGPGTLHDLIHRAKFADKTASLQETIRHFKVRLVLTAHPTQFYPSAVLGIINDMALAITDNNFTAINDYIQQLGLTPFFNKTQPTPLNEAISLIWYLNNIFYHAVGNVLGSINKLLFDNEYQPPSSEAFVELGFWPGGDRDGNPNVVAETTLKVAEKLRQAILTCYYNDLVQLKRRLTFIEVDKLVLNLEKRIHNELYSLSEAAPVKAEEIVADLMEIKTKVSTAHHNLFIENVNNLLLKVQLFGTHFASIDVRQDSRIHTQVLAYIVDALLASTTARCPQPYESLHNEAKWAYLSSLTTSFSIDPASCLDEAAKETIQTIIAIGQIQQRNGQKACQRYVISNCQSATNVLELLTLFFLSGYTPATLHIDIVPLFEMVDDLEQAEAIMETLYSHPLYSQHLLYRNRCQTVMVGFSDGTKDGGYLQANWSIYKAKEKLTAVSRKYAIKIKFFDGRGGPPSRGGGKSNKFYASLGNCIENKEIQLTIQGQTISSNFGTADSAQYNMEQLLSAGLSNDLFKNPTNNLSQSQHQLLNKLSAISYTAYQTLKAHPLFMPYLQTISPLIFFNKTNIASRPAKRGAGSHLTFDSLRAIPFVSAWSQLKQNVPGFYGVGIALQQMKALGLWSEVQALYNQSLFFKTLIENSMMSMLKSNFDLTQHLRQDPEFSEIWNLLYNEYENTKQLVFELTQTNQLMQNDEVGRQSIIIRDKIVLPLNTIQQYALEKLREKNSATMEEGLKKKYENIVVRSMFGLINAGRNSA